MESWPDRSAPCYRLQHQLDAQEYEVRINEGRVRKPADTILIPDLLVVPVRFGDPFRDHLNLAILADPLPLVVEIWLPSTGSDDIDTKIPVYQQWGRPGNLAHSPLRAHVDVLGAASGRKV
ncbi:MAG: hypothetical protein U0031_06820 [Thermomicrobiales bacterium]